MLNNDVNNSKIFGHRSEEFLERVETTGGRADYADMILRRASLYCPVCVLLRLVVHVVCTLPRAVVLVFVVFFKRAISAGTGELILIFP
jgi:hypothetical protein